MSLLRDTYLQDWQRRSSRCTNAGPIRHADNPAIVALVTGLKSRGRLKPKQIVVAAMRKLLVLCFGVSNGQTFRSRNSDGLLSHIKGSIACRISVGGGGGGHAPQPEGARGCARLDARLSLQHAFMPAGDASLKTAQVNQNAD